VTSRMGSHAEVPRGFGRVPERLDRTGRIDGRRLGLVIFASGLASSSPGDSRSLGVEVPVAHESHRGGFRGIPNE
jgi:hypothetical protein